MVRAPVGVNRNVAEDEHLTPGGHFTPGRLSGKIPDGSLLEPELWVTGFIHHRVHYRRAYHGGGPRAVYADGAG